MTREADGMARGIIIIGAAAALIVASAADAQTGATAGTPMQPGGWGAGGWRAGAAGTAYPAAPVAAPARATVYMPAYAPAAYAGAGYAPPAYATGGYAGSSYAAPAYRRRPLLRGERLRGAWRSPIYTVHDWRRYALPAPAAGQRWTRYQDDAVLVDARDRVVDARGNVDWSGAPARPVALPTRTVAPAYAAPRVTRTVERTADGGTLTTETRTETVAPGPEIASYGPGATVVPGTRTTVTTISEGPRRPTGRRSWPAR